MAILGENQPPVPHRGARSARQAVGEPRFRALLGTVERVEWPCRKGGSDVLAGVLRHSEDLPPGLMKFNEGVSDEK